MQHDFIDALCTICVNNWERLKASTNTFEINQTFFFLYDIYDKQLMNCSYLPN